MQEKGLARRRPEEWVFFKTLKGSEMGHERKQLPKSFSLIEPRKFGLGLVAGCLLITFAYFTTAKFDMVHIAMIPENAAAPPSSLVQITASSQEQDVGVQTASLKSSKDEILEKTSEGDTAPRVDANVSSLVPLPVTSSEKSTNAAEDLGAKDAEEVQKSTSILSCGSKDGQCEVENITAPKNNSSTSASLLDPVQQISPAEIRRPVEQKSEDSKPVEKKQPLCDLSDRRIDKCEIEGDVRILGKNSTVILVSPPESDAPYLNETWQIKPYPRKADPAAMKFVTPVTVQLNGYGDAPPCTENHDVPAIVFSVRGYTGNFFHAFTDVILPIFQTAYQFHGEVQFLVVNFQIWWINKYLPVFKSLTNYDMIDFDNDDRVHCFPRAMIGLTSHDDFNIDPSRSPNGYTMVDFTKFMRATYGLPRDAVTGIGAPPYRRPRMLIVAREHTRRFANLETIKKGVEKAGFEVVTLEAHLSNDLRQVGEVVNTCDAVMGVHGAGLTNIVFLPVHAVVIQIVPWGGLEGFVASYFRRPSSQMQFQYLEYVISMDESTLIDQYPRNHTVFTNPKEIHAKGWNPMKEVFLDKQDVKLNMRRFRPVLKKTLKSLQKY